MARLRSRAKNLDDRTIEQIVEILDGWSSRKLTWALLIEQIQRHTRTQYTRQALHNHERIKAAFVARKKSLTERDVKAIKTASPELQYALQRIARLEAETERLKRENNNLLEQFNRWVYNAYTKQMDNKLREFLNEPLPPVHREPSITLEPNALRKREKDK
jgi:hypothetical protein